MEGQDKPEGSNVLVIDAPYQISLFKSTLLIDHGSQCTCSSRYCLWLFMRSCVRLALHHTTRRPCLSMSSHCGCTARIKCARRTAMLFLPCLQSFLLDRIRWSRKSLIHTDQTQKVVAMKSLPRYQGRRQLVLAAVCWNLRFSLKPIWLLWHEDHLHLVWRKVLPNWHLRDRILVEPSNFYVCVIYRQIQAIMNHGSSPHLNERSLGVS